MSMCVYNLGAQDVLILGAQHILPEFTTIGQFHPPPYTIGLKTPGWGYNNQECQRLRICVSIVQANTNYIILIMLFHSPVNYKRITILGFRIACSTCFFVGQTSGKLSGCQEQPLFKMYSILSMLVKLSIIASRLSSAYNSLLSIIQCVPEKNETEIQCRIVLS